MALPALAAVAASATANSGLVPPGGSALAPSGVIGAGDLLISTPSLSTFSAYLVANPALFAGIIGGLIALGVGILTYRGVVLSLKAATTRMRNELEHATDQSRSERAHAAEEAHKERVTNTRRSVYLEAAAELVKAQMFLGGLGSQNLAELNTQAGLGGFLTAVAQVSIVGDEPTALVARDLAHKLNQIFFVGLGKLIPLAHAKGIADFHSEAHAAAHKEISRILASMTHHNETRPRDEGAFEALQRSFQVQQAAAEDHSAKTAQARDEITSTQAAYASWLMQELKPVVDGLDELTHLVRLELGISSNLGAFQEQTAKMRLEIEQAFLGFLQNLDVDRGL